MSRSAAENSEGISNGLLERDVSVYYRLFQYHKGDKKKAMDAMERYLKGKLDLSFLQVRPAICKKIALASRRIAELRKHIKERATAVVEKAEKQNHIPESHHNGSRSEATSAIPGSPAKIEAMRERETAGLPLWNPNDRVDYES